MKKKFLKKLSIIILTVMLITLQQNVSILANSVPEIYSSTKTSHTQNGLRTLKIQYFS